MAEVHGNRTIAENSGKMATVAESGAKSGALPPDSNGIDPDLQAVIDAWPQISPAMKMDILTLIGVPDRTPRQ